ncbi:MAG: hypothetical protein ABJA74_00370 [Lapillicoccus sp.]
MVHVTDRLFGASPEEAAEVVDQLAGRARLALALHDIPQPAEGSQWYARRSRAYAAMGQAARVVVVASEHERKALGRCLDDATGSPSCDSRVVVVPLPIEQGAEERTHPPRRDVGTAEVGILGYLYPGKGVEDVLAAVTVLRREALDVRVTCLGAPAEGHADYADELARRATDAQVPFRITGYLPDAELPSRLRAVDVPVASHRHISASGSMNTWLEAGRRPVTLPSPYARELTARIPGALEITEDLVAGVREALDHPEGTWLNSDVALGPSVAEVARQHADLLDALRNTLDAAGAPVERTPAR